MIMSFKPGEVMALVEQGTFIVDMVLNNEYNYGLSPSPDSFGFKANFFTSFFMLELILQGVEDIEKLAEAAHKGWAHAALTCEDIYANDAKKIRRENLANTRYQDLSNEEQEKDRVAARGLLQYVRQWK